MEFRHYPVMNNEIVTLFGDAPGGWVIDCTLGMGGHAHHILEKNPHLNVIGLDLDRDSLQQAKKNLSPYSQRVELLHKNYVEVFSAPEVLERRITGILVDPGISMVQLKDPQRGFSHNIDSPLDMRKNPEQALTAWEVVNTYSEHEIVEILRDFGEVRRAPELAKRIIESRLFAPVETTGQLKKIVESVFGSRVPRGKVHPAARVFQALRIWVNRELDGVDSFLNKIPSVIERSGVVLFLTYHSVEDRIVKTAFKNLARRELVRIIKPFPMLPQEGEIRINPPSRSAKLRAAVIQ